MRDVDVLERTLLGPHSRVAAAPHPRARMTNGGFSLSLSSPVFFQFPSLPIASGRGQLPQWVLAPG